MGGRVTDHGGITDPSAEELPASTMIEVMVLADLLGAGSNQLAEMLQEWSAILKHSSLGCEAPNTNERKDGSPPRVCHMAAVRRRKTA